MRRARTVPVLPVLVAGVAALLVGFSAAPAQACKCMQLAAPQAYEQAVAVFEGHVVEIQEPASGQSGPANPRIIRLQVPRSWKGVESEAVELRTAADSAACGFAFTKGQSYLVYAYAEDGQLRVSSCSRTRLMSEAGEDLQTMGMGATPVEPTLAPTSGSVPLPTKAAEPPARGGCASCTLGARFRRPGVGSLTASGLLIAWAALRRKRPR